MTERAGLLAALEAAAAELGAVSHAAERDIVSWSRAGIVFATLRGGTVELRVGATIGAAAMRTPDTAASSRGGEWVAFSPRELDAHALDRLEAWFAAAHRRAAA